MHYLPHNYLQQSLKALSLALEIRNTNQATLKLESAINRSVMKQRQRFSQNLGFMDRQARTTIGTLMIATPMFAVPETMGLWSILVLAAIPVLSTAIIGWDPLYELMEKTTYVTHEENIQQSNWSCANIGIIDRGIRFGVGLTLLYALMRMGTMTTEMALTLLAIPLIVSAITAWDPICAALKINSFGSRIDVEAAEPDVDRQTLAEYYEFAIPQQSTRHYLNAA